MITEQQQRKNRVLRFALAFLLCFTLLPSALRGENVAVATETDTVAINEVESTDNATTSEQTAESVGDEAAAANEEPSELACDESMDDAPIADVADEAESTDETPEGLKEPETEEATESDEHPELIATADDAFISLAPASATERGGTFTPQAAPSFTSWHVPNPLIYFNINNGIEANTSLRVLNGSQVAYCLDIHLDAPNTGDAYNTSAEPGLAFYAVLLFGYPTRTNIGGYDLSAEQAREATQFAIWGLADKLGAPEWADVSTAFASAQTGGAETLAAGMWLYNRCVGLPNTSMALVDPNDYFDMGTLHEPTDTTPSFWDTSGETLRSGPYTISSVLAGANPAYILPPFLIKTELPSYAYYGNTVGEVITSVAFNAPFYVYLNRSDMPETGTATIQSGFDFTAPAALVWKPAQSSYQSIYAPADPGQGYSVSFIPLSWGTPVVSKLDADTNAPLADTEFVLYRYPVTVEDGTVTTDTSLIAADDPGWLRVGEAVVTDASGRLDFGPLPYGYYQIVETRPNPAYIENSTPRFIVLDKHATGEVQVFTNEAIQLSCEVYKDTINLTSAALRTDDEDYLKIDNTNSETYHYDLDFRSTSNVRADEFTVIDPLENSSLGQVRLEELFTPVAWGDTDGRFNLWYRTNLTDPAQIYSTASALATNPYNPNNPTQQQRWPSTGWQLWREGLSTTQTTHLLVADLGLAEGEYLTGLRFEYGSVEVGFTARNTVRAGLQEERADRAAASDWTPRTGEGFYSPQAAAAGGLKPATYLVSCPGALRPPALIASSAQVFIARNLVLTDEDEDQVQTEVIQPFMLQTNSQPPTDITHLTGTGTPASGSLPRTGDTVFQLALLLALSALLGCGLMFKRYQLARRRP